MNATAPESDWFTLDTTTLPLEDVPGNPGARRHTLLEVPGTPGFVRIDYGPPGFPDNVRALLEHGVHRHYHRSVTERHYILAGDYPIWHWRDLATEGALTRLRRHHYLENPPYTVHGIVPGSVPQTGYAILQWTDGYGTDLFEPGAKTETITVSPDAAAHPDDLSAPICFHADERPWLPHASVAGWQIRELGVEMPGCPAARLVNIAAGAARPPARTGLRTAGWKWLLVISGDLRLAAGSETRELHEGTFLAWRADTTVELDRDRPSRAGAVVLCVGHDLATVG
jgi:hypothetical protein